MRIVDIYSKRQQKARGEIPDIYEYDKLPHPLRVQIVKIIEDAFGISHYGHNEVSELYGCINDILCREYGVFAIVENTVFPGDAVITYLLHEESIEKALNVVELCFKSINTVVRDNRRYKKNTDRKIKPDEAITELNIRFKEHGIGYQFESNEIIRIDSEIIHTEAIKPTINFLRQDGFEGPNEEYLNSLEHYRHGRFKESMVDALKSFESTMKTICTLSKWTYKSDDTASKLISICIENGLLPTFLEPQYNSLKSLLESGVPTIRNKRGGHGQGPKPIIIPEYLARYAINLTASSILFIVESYEERKTPNPAQEPT